MTKKEFDLEHALILLAFDSGNIDTNEYVRQLDVLVAKFGEEYEEGCDD